MKRILSFLVLSALAVLLAVNVFAADATVNVIPASSTVAPGGTITFTISISGTYDGYAIDIPKSGNGYIVSSVSPSGGANADNLGDRWCVSIMPGQDVQNSYGTTIVDVTVVINSTASGSVQLELGDVIVANTFGDMADFSIFSTSVTVQNQSNTDHSHSSTKWESNAEMHWHKCECGTTYDNATHNFDAGTVTKAATCNQKGEIVYTCLICNYKKTVALEVSHAAGEWEVVKESTCTEEGKKQQRCKICGEVMDELTTEKLSHSFGEWQVAQEATEYQRGVEERLCENCGIKESREIGKTEVTTVTTAEEPEITATQTVTNQSYATEEPGNSAPAVTTAPEASEENTTTLPEGNEVSNTTSSPDNAQDTDDNIMPLIIILIVVVILAASGMIVLVIKKR